MNIPVAEVRASDLIRALQNMINQHGDRYVYISSGDYPGPVTMVYLVGRGKGDGYTPDGVVVIT